MVMYRNCLKKILNICKIQRINKILITVGKVKLFFPEIVCKKRLKLIFIPSINVTLEFIKLGKTEILFETLISTESN